MADYPDSQVTVYGHSLGSMCAQYALANLDDHYVNRIQGGYLYQGPNIYGTLTEDQKARADSYKDRGHNYVDNRDLIAFGYSDQNRLVTIAQAVAALSNAFSTLLSDVTTVIAGRASATASRDQAVGQVHFVDSDEAGGITAQHMWGGYRFDAEGNLILVDGDKEANKYYTKYASLCQDLGGCYPKEWSRG